MEEYKMKGYIARDKYNGESGSNLHLGKMQPKYDKFCGAWHDFGEFMALPKEWFPELKYTDEPIEVNIIIEKEKRK